MQNPCQDSYYTLFSSYPMLLDYHEEQAKNSRWIRCKVADLQVEPLGESSPLIGNLSAFAAGTSQEAVKDTAENLGLAMRVNGELYPVRMTAYKSLLDRAKIGGTALPKLSREVLAEVLNECLKLYSRMKRLYHTRVWYGRFLLCFSEGGESDVLIAVIIIVTTNRYFIHSMPSWHVAYIAVKHAVKRYVFFLLWWHAKRRHGNGPQTGLSRTG